MRFTLLLLLGLVVASPSHAQQPGANIPVRRLLSDTTRLRMLEAQVQALADTLAWTRTDLASATAALQQVLDKIHSFDGGKADDGTSTDLWSMLRRLRDRVCKGESGCP